MASVDYEQFKGYVGASPGRLEIDFLSCFRHILIRCAGLQETLPGHL